MNEIIENADLKMKKCTEILKKEFGSVRAGRAMPSLLDKIIVEYYDTPTPLNQLATITAPELRLLVIQPWDKNIISNIEKAILKSDLGLTPNSDGSVIRLAIPQLTEERRKELVKVIRKKAEESKVAIRNVRREANDLLKTEEKESNISEDELRIYQEEVNGITKSNIEDIDNLLALKEKEVMEV
ncbi:MAG TPA: ribosome recycling factor [Firmicutes bacterium]|jgi:ribosome recycling factor|nr:ribosome recycling factor [Bacillota bacterium]